MKATHLARILTAATLCAAALSFADEFDVRGRAVDASTSSAVQGASVRLAVDGLSATTDASGNFRLLKQSTALSGAFSAARAEFLPATRELRLRLGAAGPVELTLFDVRGRAQTLHSANLDAGEYAFSLDALLERPLSAGLYVLRAKTREFSETFRIAGTGDVSRAQTAAPVLRVAKGSTPIDTVVLEKDGYVVKRVALLERTIDLGDVELTPIPVNRTVAVATYPADIGTVSPAASNTVADGAAFTASVALPTSAAGDTTVYRSKGWNDANHTVSSDEVSIASVNADMSLVDTVSILRVTSPAIGATYTKGDSVTLTFEGINLPNNVFVVMCPDRNCAQTDTVLKNVSKTGGTFKFPVTTKWAAGNEYYLKVIVDDNFWARVKEIAVNDAPDVWTPVALQSSITKALPMTGLVFWTTSYKSGYDDATALEFGYCYPAAVVKGKKGDTIEYDWSSFDAMLDEAAARHHQEVVRIAYENPTDPAWDGVVGHTAVPEYIKKDSVRYNYHETTNTVYGNNVHYADWRSTELKWFTKQFITDFAKRYDNDPRVAFLEVGFGHWSEYHIYGTKVKPDTNFPSAAFQKEYAEHVDATLKSLPWIIGIAAGDPSAPYKTDAELRSLNYGMLDDSFMHREHDISQGDGYNEKCWNALDYTQHWQTAANGGEISFYDYEKYGTEYAVPKGQAYDHLYFLRPEGVHGRTWAQQAAKYHITFMLAGGAVAGSYGTPAHFLQGALASGYKFRVTSFERTSSKARATVKNEGVAPIYRDAWVAVNGTRASRSLKGLLPGDSLTVTIPATGELDLAIECDHTVGRPIQYLANLE